MSTAASSAARPAVLFLHGPRRPRSLLILQFRRPITNPSLSLSISSSLFSHRGRGRARGRRRSWEPEGRSKTSPSDRDLELSIDFDAAAAGVAAALARIRRSSEAKLRLFLSSGAEAYHDLLTSVRLDQGHRYVFSCRQSSLLFVANLFIWSFVAVLAARVLVWLWSGLGLGFRTGWWSGDRMVVRRDRSLGGREVVVGRRIMGRDMENSFRVSGNPLSLPRSAEVTLGRNSFRRPVQKQEKLPNWWPDLISSPVVLVDQESQREANKLVRAIMDNRMSGKDYKDDDFIQLHKICKISGAKVSFETDYARDSFYRASVDFVLRICSRVKVPSDNVQIDGEEARQFIAGLADNIGLQNIRAATLVRAAVAAHTRSCFLQCWALEVQGKRSDALEEVSKICRVYQIFPPEEHSPEMEMVASGLKRHLQVEQRQHLLTMYREVCGAEHQNIAADALALAEVKMQIWYPYRNFYERYSDVQA